MAAENARLNSSDWRIWASATRVFVTVVPIFAPIINGIAVWTDIISAPTIPTITEVLVDDDADQLPDPGRLTLGDLLALLEEIINRGLGLGPRYGSLEILEHVVQRPARVLLTNAVHRFLRLLVR